DIMTHGISLSVDQHIATIHMDLPGEKVNKLTSQVLSSISETLTKLATRDDVKILVFKSGKPGVFIAGADINEISGITTYEDAEKLILSGQSVINQIAALPFPSVAAINGACVGGGLELALACSFRVASDHDKTKLGLPEVNLGIIPGFGGTQRLPRLIGLKQALPLVLTGKMVDGKRALKLGLVEACFPDAFFDDNLADFLTQLTLPSGIEKVLKKRSDRSRKTWFIDHTFVGRRLACRMARKSVLSKTKGHYPAPLSAVVAVRKGLSMPLDKALVLEAKACAALIPTSISKNLIGLYFSQEQLKKESGVDGEVSLLNIESSAVVGSGLMGSGIAWLLSYKGIFVRLKDNNWESISKGISGIKVIFDNLIKRKKINKSEHSLAMHRISGTTTMAGFQQADFVIEAIFENLKAKQDLFKEVEDVVSEKTIIASNTSSLSIDQLAEKMIHPERFVGMHFFSPVNRMPLVEVISGEKTSPDTVATVVALAKRLGKTPIVVKNCPGFLVNRILMPYMIEAIFCLQDGANVKGVDKVMESFGMPLGPLSLADEVGLDVGYKVAKQLEEGYGERMRVAETLEIINQDENVKGKKSSQGFYLYKGKTKRENPDIEGIVSPYRSPSQEQCDDSEIRDRLVLVMLNEASRCLEEKIVASPTHLDMAMIMGTGFPPFRGGLCRFGDEMGLGAVVDRLQTLSGKYGIRFAPSAYLVELANQGEGFYS
ncbi:MAG: 3-hydroxyacyl-CoA dehydrogenase/enoyl-CoA hydratase/3-hydroxybutyryl-CoA epimerase, partial [Candidatus Marinamargulisbacteria bacterium]